MSRCWHAFLAPQVTSLILYEDDTFDALHKGIAENWVARDETVKPFGDRRQIVRSICSFDLDQETLFYSDETFGYGHIKIPISRFRDTIARPVQQDEFSPFELASPPPLKLADFPPPFKKPSTPISNPPICIHVTCSLRLCGPDLS